MAEETPEAAPAEVPAAPAPVEPTPRVANGNDSFDFEVVGEDTKAVFQQYLDQGGELPEATPAPEGESEEGAPPVVDPAALVEGDTPILSPTEGGTLPTVPPAAPVSEAPVDDADAALIKKFNLLSEEANKVRKAQEAVTASQAEVEKAKALEARLKANPMEVLEELGWNYEAITEKVIQGDKATPVQPEIAALKQQVEEMKAAMAAQQEASETAQQQAAERAYKESIPAQIRAKQEEYPYLAGVYTDEQLSDTVFDIMKNVYNSDQRVLSLDETATYLENELRRQATVLQGVKAPSQTQEPGGSTSPAAAAVTPPKSSAGVTLTHANTQSATPVTQDTDEILPFEESLQNMAAQLAAAAAED